MKFYIFVCQTLRQSSGKTYSVSEKLVNKIILTYWELRISQNFEM